MFFLKESHLFRLVPKIHIVIKKKELESKIAIIIKKKIISHDFEPTYTDRCMCNTDRCM